MLILFGPIVSFCGRPAEIQQIGLTLKGDSVKLTQIRWTRVAIRLAMCAMVFGVATSSTALAQQGGCRGGGGGGGRMGGGPPGGFGMSSGGSQAGGDIMQMMQAAQQMQSQQLQALQAQRMQAAQLQQLRMQEQMQASFALRGDQSAMPFSPTSLSGDSGTNGRNSFAATPRRRLPGYGQPTARELREERLQRRRAARLADRDG